MARRPSRRAVEHVRDIRIVIGILLMQCSCTHRDRAHDEAQRFHVSGELETDVLRALVQAVGLASFAAVVLDSLR
jgi:hypothetical protein